jgi:dienelactone hydrolase
MPSLVFIGCKAHCGTGCVPVDRSSLNIISLPTSGLKHYETAQFGKEGAPPVLLVHAMNGASSQTLILGERIAEWGYHVFVPNLYGEADMDFGANDVGAARKYFKMSDDWTPGSFDDIGPIKDRVQEIADDIYSQCGQKVAVIGNCLTGILPLEMMASKSVSIGVICQPATPLATPLNVVTGNQSKKKRHSLGVSEAALEKALLAMKSNPSKRLAGFHYSYDPLAPMDRFDELLSRLKAAGLDKRFSAYVLHPEKSTPDEWWEDSQTTTAARGWISPHSTVINAKPEEDIQWFQSRLRDFLNNHHH